MDTFSHLSVSTAVMLCVDVNTVDLANITLDTLEPNLALPKEVSPHFGGWLPLCAWDAPILNLTEYDHSVGIYILCSTICSFQPTAHSCETMHTICCTPSAASPANQQFINQCWSADSTQPTWPRGVLCGPSPPTRGASRKPCLSCTVVSSSGHLVQYIRAVILDNSYIVQAYDHIWCWLASR